MSVSENVANVLERETSGTIDNWYGRVEKENDLITVALSREAEMRSSAGDVS